MNLPLVPPVSQFDGSAFASANCAAASAARLRWYMTGEKTTGAQIRTAQYDKVGGISLPDCGRAFSNLLPVVHPAWAAPTDGTPNPPSQFGGYITQTKLDTLLKTGQMVLIQGDYGDLPLQYRKQGNFTGDHTFTADAVRIHPVTKARDYYVVDTIPRPNTAYDGEWIPSTAIMAYAYGLAGQGRIFAMWGKPKAPPPVVSKYTIEIEAHATVRIYDLKPQVGKNACIVKPWTDDEWGDTASSAPCESPADRVTCDGTSSATTVRVLGGRYKGKHIRVGHGTSVVSR